jgi:CheY-like chemotaxis protein
VNNGEQAVAACLAAAGTETPFDVVLMDTQMPVMDGLLATARLRAAGYDRPIVALTAHTLPEHEEFCRDAGYDEFLSKPVDRIKLTDAVRIWAYRGAKARAARPTAESHAASGRECSPRGEASSTTTAISAPVLSPL